jgi:hypothetical protein
MLYAFYRVALSVLILSIIPPVLSAAQKRSMGVTLVATAECSLEIRVTTSIAVP